MTGKGPVPVEELLSFPCDHLFKAFGPASPPGRFPAAVQRAVERVLPVARDALKVRASGKGNYLCVTVLARLHNGRQLAAVYAELRQVEGLQYLL